MAIQWQFFARILAREKHHNLEGVKSDLFEKIIHYFYLGPKEYADLSLSDAYRLLTLADYYGFDKQLVDYCSFMLKANVSGSSWKDVLFSGLRLDDNPSLRDVVFQKVKNSNPEEIAQLLLDLNQNQAQNIKKLKTEAASSKQESDNLKNQFDEFFKEYQHTKQTLSDIQAELRRFKKETQLCSPETKSSEQKPENNNNDNSNDTKK